MLEKADTLTRVLDVAQDLVRERGFNAMSFADIGRRLSLRTASVHYHFPTKADLGTALVRRYRERLVERLAELDGLDLAPAERLLRYVAAYREVVQPDGRICLCTVLAGDSTTLPHAMRGEVDVFFGLNERWLAGVLAEGRAGGTLSYAGTPEAAAEGLLATLEGAMLLARSSGDVSRFDAILRGALGGLQAA